MVKITQNRVKLATVVVSLIMFVLVPKSWAQEESKIPSWVSNITKISGKAYLQWTLDLSEGKEQYNAFDLTRFYLGNVEAPVSEKVKLAYKTDIFRDEDGYFHAALKSGYIECKDFPYKGAKLSFGQADIPWVGYDESVWGYRFKREVMADIEGYLTSTDVGIGLAGDIPKDYGNYHVALVNGEGWKKAESSRYKDFHARLTLRPLASNKNMNWLFVSAFGALGFYDNLIKDEKTGKLVPPTGKELESQNKIRTIGQFGFKNEKITIAGQFVLTNDPADKMKKKHPSLADKAKNENSTGMGISAYLVLSGGLLSDNEQLKKMSLVARFDNWDPDKDIDANSHNRIIAGIGCKASKNLQCLLNFETTIYGEKAKIEDSRIIALNIEAGF